MLEEKGVPREGGPIGVMLEEHNIGREYIRGLEEGVKKFYMGIETGLRDIIENGTGYIQLLRNHIWKEDNILFQIALQFLNEDDDAKLVEEFEEIEEKRIGHGKHEELAKSIEDLSKEFN